MEGDKKHVSAGAASSSSLAAELFGTKESPPSSSAGVFASIFPPPSTVLKKSSNSAGAGTWHKYQHHSGKHGTTAMNGEAGSYGIMGHSRERMEPCHLSSSIYYGGQENYSQSPSSQSPGSYPIFKKDGEEDDPNGNNSTSASRGNWWQGFPFLLCYSLCSQDIPSTLSFSLMVSCVSDDCFFRFSILLGPSTALPCRFPLLFSKGIHGNLWDMYV
ncbi:unnamed protein product [Linum tenue]|uniref:Uncharacterized protein n=1 Tax=Linum tenue TaxID=586396 RepID=A0AAV0Q4T0_9ROSI|nr:unnamed protein product [Linum tenue]